jgi:GT2 family glycosyltransferase
VIIPGLHGPLTAETSSATPLDAVPVASVIVVATNELHHLRDCLPSLAALDGPPTEVIVVDNASTDGTGAALAAAYSWVRTVRSERQLGYAPANNLGFRHARGDYLVVLNPDTRVDPGFVRGLIETSRARGDRALVTSRICMFDCPTTINTVGNIVHFSLIAACRGLGDPCERRATTDEVPSISGCAFLIPRRVLDDLGPFDEAIYPYLEDTELSLRAWLGGYSCVTAPASLVFHKYSIRLQTRKFFYIERNRWLVMLRTFRIPTLVLLLPPLLLIEAMSWAYAARLGRAHLGAKARSYASILRLLPIVRRGRQQSRALRRVGDRLLLAKLAAELPIGQLVHDVGASRGVLSAINGVLVAYYAVVRRIVWW